MSERAEIVRYTVPELLGRQDPDDKLLAYFELLVQENQRLNLVSRETGFACSAETETPARFPGLAELAVESLIPFDLIPPRSYQNYLDIGSGGGFPALPIIRTREIGQVCLVERTRKKAAALRRILQALDRPARIEPTDFSEIKFGEERFDLITMRLVRLEPPLLKKIAKLLTDDGTFIYYSRREIDFSALNLAADSALYAPEESSELHACTIFTKKL